MFEFLVQKLGTDVAGVTKVLNKQSGLLGISGRSNDMRTLEEAAEAGDEQAAMAREVFCYRLAKYVAALTVPLGRLDALIFTGGIGERDPDARARTLGRLAILGFEVDPERNAANGRDSNGVITADGSPVALVVPTNEELLIAQDTAALIG
jgi:acetate kinase